MDGQQRIEKVGQPDPLGFGHQTKERAICVKAPGAALGDDLNGRLPVAVQKLVRRASRGILVRQIDGNVTDPLHVDDRDQLVRKDTLDRGPRDKSSSFAIFPPWPRFGRTPPSQPDHQYLGQ